jgi:hypothetical protein
LKGEVGRRKVLPAISRPALTEIKAKLAEIVENLRRSDLTPEEASLQRAEYARLSAVDRGEIEPDMSVAQLGQVTRGGGRNGSGVRQAAREIGVSQTQIRRDITIASLTEEQRAPIAPRLPFGTQ